MEYFNYKELLKPPIARAAYSDRTAWFLAEMSKIAYLKFENKIDELVEILSKANFELINIFCSNGTQAFLAKRKSDKMAILSFRGTEQKEINDIIADLNAVLYCDKNGVKVHQGFYSAFMQIYPQIIDQLAGINDYALYITGHSLGGALAMIATYKINSDNLAACYTFGSPKVGNEEFDDQIKTPIYRIVNAYDIVPIIPPSTILVKLFQKISWLNKYNFTEKIKGYEHHGDMRYLTICKDDFENLKVIANYNEFFRICGIWINKKESINNHSIDSYCEKLARWALKRLD